MSGKKKQASGKGASMVTSAIRGDFETNAAMRNEFLQLIAR